MKKTTLILLAGLLLAPIAPAAASDSLHIAYSVFQASKNNEKHPALLTQTVTINQDMAVPRLCIAYDNTASRKTGWGVANIQIIRVDGTEESARLAEQVRNFSFVKCTKPDLLADFVAGDMLVFEYDFENMKRLKRKGDRIDRVEVNSVVVADGFPLPLGTVGAVPGEEEDGKKGGWFHSSNFNFQAAKNNQKHPVSFTKMIVMQQDIAAPNVCSLYRNTFKKQGAGKLTTEVSVSRDDEIVESLTYKSRVKKNTAKKCKIAQDMLAGDVVVYDFLFEGMPRLKKTSNKTDYAETTGVVSANGTAEFATVSSDPGDPAPGPGPDPTPPPTGGLSSADIAAAGKLLIGNRPVQLWRAKTSWNRSKWWVIGPRTVIDTSQLGNVVPNTYGIGNTISAAVADYEKKRGKLSGNGTLSSADVKMLVWYNGINSSGGPTSVRRDRSGGFFGEFFRPGKGAQHNGPFGSPAKALEWIRAQGI